MSTVTLPISQVDREPIFTLEHVEPVYRGGSISKYQTRVTVGLIAELLESEKIWVDYDYQRGVKVTHGRDGIEKRTPMVDVDRVEEIAGKILENRLYGGSLTWNLREREVQFRYDHGRRALYVLGGKPTIPDSNHRHQAMLKVAQLVKTRGYSFDLNSYEFPLLIEVLDIRGESDLFYEYNQLGKPANPTRSRYINQADLHNALASQLVEASVLKGHVELVTNNISRNSTKVATFNTLAKGIALGFPELDESNIDDIRAYLVNFFNRLVTIRPEAGYLDLSARKPVRETSIADTALIYSTYARLAGDLYHCTDWATRLAKLAEPYKYINNGTAAWEGDLMSRQNPIWQETVLVHTRSGGLSVANRTDSRKYAYEVLRQVVGLE
jgi:hypothetical protein